MLLESQVTAAPLDLNFALVVVLAIVAIVSIATIAVLCVVSRYSPKVAGEAVQLLTKLVDLLLVFFRRMF